MFANKIKSYNFNEVKFVDGELVFPNEYNLFTAVTNNINENKELYTKAAFVIAYSLFLSANPTLIFANPCTWIENLGNGAISVIQMTGIKLLTGAMIIELVREGLRGGSHNYSRILTSYAILIAGVIFAPEFVELLKSFVDSYRP